MENEISVEREKSGSSKYNSPRAAKDNPLESVFNNGYKRECRMTCEGIKYKVKIYLLKPLSAKNITACYIHAANISNNIQYNVTTSLYIYIYSY